MLTVFPAVVVVPCSANGGGGTAALLTGRVSDPAWNSPVDPLTVEWGRLRPEVQKPGMSGGAVRETQDRWFARDKAQHFVASFLMAGAAGYSVNHRWNRGRSQGVQWGFGAALSGGILKEIKDLRHPGARASLKDLAADLAGAAAGALLLSWW